VQITTTIGTTTIGATEVMIGTMIIGATAIMIGTMTIGIITLGGIMIATMIICDIMMTVWCGDFKLKKLKM
jgi:hypothetical protein